MSRPRSSEALVGLVRELLRLPSETEWVEVKCDNDHADKIGEYLSALANSAAVEQQPFSYVLWGIEDRSRRIVGTTFDPSTAKRGNEDLEPWLRRLLTPDLDFHFSEVAMPEGRVVLLEIPKAYAHPVRFQGTGYIRVKSYKKKLKDYPERERALWRALEDGSFEDGLARQSLTTEEALSLLDVDAYFRLLNQARPPSTAAALETLAADGLLLARGSSWDITRLGALLLARDLTKFGRLGRKAVRVIVYKGDDRVRTVRERVINAGYAAGFEDLVRDFNDLLPSNEVIGQALRKDVPVYPELAVREIVANALIHQDLSVTGAGPMLEIFDNRMEVTNPGEPLVPTDRFVDCPPRSRNEALAAMMRRFGVCEERGSGIDKVLVHIEVHQLPAPMFEAPGDSTRVTLFAPRLLSEMDREEKRRAVYWHACLRLVQGKRLTNASLRQRFGIDQKNSALASRLIKDALDSGRIALADPLAGNKERSYVPFWAVDREAP